MLLKKIEKEASLGMDSAVRALQGELLKLRTGRASASLLENMQVDAYGTPVPLQQVASITVEDARTLAITVWDQNTVKSVEKAIMASDLGIQPNTAGAVIRVMLPPLTTERRRQFVKMVGQLAEQARISVRHARRDANKQLDMLLAEKEISEDEKRRVQDKVQKITDQFVARVEALCAEKEKALLHV